NPFFDRKLTHAAFIAVKMDEWDYRKAQLETQYHLTENEQITQGGFTEIKNREKCRGDRQGPGKKPPEPGTDPEIKISFHYDLSGERPGDRGALPGGDQGDCKQGRGQRTEQVFQQTVRVLYFVNHNPVFIKRGRSQDQNGRVHKECQVQGDGGIKKIEFQGFPQALGTSVQFPGLHQGGVQVQIVRHHRSADNADGDIKRLPRQKRRFNASHYFTDLRFGNEHFRQKRKADY